MLTWQVAHPAPVIDRPLRRVTAEIPEPDAGELLIRVTASGVCRTDLYTVQGDLPPHMLPVVPGHEAVGVVVDHASDVVGFRRGERVGVSWLRYTCGACRPCRAGREHLCVKARFTGWDTDGGYAQYAVVPAAYAFRVPEHYTDVEAAPLLCAGAVGHRALACASLPEGGQLGIYGFGAAAHLAMQTALESGAQVHVLTRVAAARKLALALGASSVGDGGDVPPVPLDAAILFAPVGAFVPPALSALDRGGILVVAALHLSEIPALTFRHHFGHDRTLRSVTGVSRADTQAFLDLAAHRRFTVTTTTYGLGEADRALADLAADHVEGAAVLVP